jgi:hypothetical protein
VLIRAHVDYGPRSGSRLGLGGAIRGREILSFFTSDSHAQFDLEPPLVGRIYRSSSRIRGVSTAHANVDIIPDFLSSITTRSDAVQIEGAIDSAIRAFRSLYGNNLTVTVDFSYTQAPPATC